MSKKAGYMKYIYKQAKTNKNVRILKEKNAELEAPAQAILHQIIQQALLHHMQPVLSVEIAQATHKRAQL